MSVVDSIRSFIEFCRDVMDSSPYGPRQPWRANVINFELKFNELPDKFEKVFARFMKDHWSEIEKPIFKDEDLVDDAWIKLPAAPSAAAIATQAGSWSRRPKAAKGVVLDLNPDSEKVSAYYLPLAELYAICCRLNATEQNLGKIPFNAVPVVFLQKLYQCFAAIEPTNYQFDKNVADLTETYEYITEADDGEAVTAGDVAVIDGETDMSAEEQMMMKMVKSFDMSDIIAKVSAMPMARKMASHMLKLDAQGVDILFQELPVMAEGLQKSATTQSGDSAIKVLLESETIQRIASNNAESITRLQAIATAAKEGKVTIEDSTAMTKTITPEVVDEAEEQD